LLLLLLERRRRRTYDDGKHAHRFLNGLLLQLLSLALLLLLAGHLCEGHGLEEQVGTGGPAVSAKRDGPAGAEGKSPGNPGRMGAPWVGTFRCITIEEGRISWNPRLMDPEGTVTKKK
jgi:hypothetical protein